MSQEAYRCLACGERCDADNPWLHLNPDLDLDHRAQPDLASPVD
jgi:hypothetical protein